ncbi:MAG TPA: GxxExxY protein [Rariglobus sp.]|jgi:GxxExxY protein|nr:GxxExxY protein [Rariglobus sp.]
MEFDPLSHRILGCALEVHRTLGPGLLESVYEKALAWELAADNLKVVVQAPIPVTYKGRDLDCGFRIDILVENSIIVELKTVDALAPIHEAQLLTYLKLSGHRIGLLINFNVPLLKHGIKRLVA